MHSMASFAANAPELATDEDDLHVPFHGDPEGLAVARQRAIGGVQPFQAPAVAMAATLQACQVSVPYGIEPGMAIRSAELWAKAFAQVPSRHTASLQPCK